MGKIDIAPQGVQKFQISQLLKQNIAIIQMSQMELIDYIEKEVDLNPFISQKRTSSNFVNLNIIKPKSLYEDLMDQATPLLKTQEKAIAQQIFGNLTKEGFISNIKITSEIKKILKKIQTLEPAGICALNLKDALLIQLERQEKTCSIAYKIIKLFYEDLIHRKWKPITKYFNISIEKLKLIIKEDIASLNLRPADNYQVKEYNSIIIDIIIDDNLNLSLNRKYLPKLLINKTITQSSEKIYKFYYKNAIDLIENLHRRDKLLLKIGKYLLKHEKQFFLNNAKMQLLSISDLAKFCKVHKSTIHRCLKNKYLQFSNCILPLVNFFKGREIPQENLLTHLKEIIENENKAKPLSDFSICLKLNQQNISLSRRTVAKYRKKLKIPKATLRKIF